MKGGSQTVTSMPDPRTQSYVDYLRRAALGYAGIGGPNTGDPNAGQGQAYGSSRRGGFWDTFQAKKDLASAPYTPLDNLPQATIDPALLEALKGYQGYASAGQTGLTALAGGANPFMNQYLSALNPIYDQIRAQSLGSIGDQAQLAGAFGGSRQGVAEGVALGQIGQNQAAANIDAYNQSLQRAAQAAQFGLAGLGGQGMLAQYLQEYPQLFASRQLGILNQGIGPYGTTQTTQTESDPFSQLLGLGLLASNFIVPGAGAAGSAILGNPMDYSALGFA